MALDTYLTIAGIVSAFLLIAALLYSGVRRISLRTLGAWSCGNVLSGERARDGGVYRWARNPQYATAIIAFGTLGLAAYSWETTALAAALVLIYALMAIAEEGWLEAWYGRAYVEYRAEVPRFFNVRHALRMMALRKSSIVQSQRENR